MEAYPRDQLLELVTREVQLRREASTNGGEYAGPCPWCGGEDRFRVWPEKGRYWCRQCGRKGDAIQYLRDHDGLTYREACERLGIGVTKQQSCPTRYSGASSPRPIRSQDELGPPSKEWQASGLEFAAASQRHLWEPVGIRALAWLRGRGLSDDTIRTAGLGYNPADTYQKPEAWGLSRDHKQIWLPRGVVIPWMIGGELWRVNIRRPMGEPKYVGPAGSSNGLYNADALNGRRPVVLLEGEIDALTVQQYAGDIVAAVATGSTGGSRHLRWVGQLALAPSVLVAYDADEGGEKAARYWIEHLSLAKRWRPYWSDANAMAQDGVDIRAWVQNGLQACGHGLADRQTAHGDELCVAAPPCAPTAQLRAAPAENKTAILDRLMGDGHRPELAQQTEPETFRIPLDGYSGFLQAHRLRVVGGTPNGPNGEPTLFLVDSDLNTLVTTDSPSVAEP